MAKNNFAKTIYVKTETTDGQTYLVADENPASLVSTGEKVRLAVYQLVEVKEATGTVHFKPSR